MPLQSKPTSTAAYIAGPWSWHSIVMSVIQCCQADFMPLKLEYLGSAQAGTYILYNAFIVWRGPACILIEGSENKSSSHHENKKCISSSVSNEVRPMRTLWNRALKMDRYARLSGAWL